MARAMTGSAIAVGAAVARDPGDVGMLRLAVPDMHCGGCMRKVEQALLKLSGVSVARANLSDRRVSIVARDGAADAERCIAALRTAGFAATVLAEDRRTQRTARDDDLVRRLGVAGFAAANIMLMSVAVWSGHGDDMPASLQTLFHWLSALIALPAIAYSGQPFFSSARKALTARRLNMDVPISLGVSLATAMSLYQTVRGSEQVYFDAAVTLLFFLLIGRALDERMRRRAESAAENLLGLRSPATSVIGADGGIRRIPTSDVRPGDRIVVAAGERIPVDARLTRGTTEVDESLMSGESRPRMAQPGDRLYCGTINLSAPIEAEVTAVADNTLLAEIARLMATAEQARGNYVRLADRAARFYAPAVHVLSAATFAGWLLDGTCWEPALTAAIAVLIITCPCALALAVPAVQVVAAGRLFRSGVILKAPDGLERLAEIDTIVLDKTGTLTLGEPRLADPATVPGRTLALPRRWRAAAVTPTLVRSRGRPEDRRITPAVVEEVHEIAGAGLVGSIEGCEIRLGSALHCGADEGHDQTASIWFQRRRCAAGRARNGRGAQVPMQWRRSSALVERGYAIEMLSGDRATRWRISHELVGIGHWRAAQKPNDKLAHLAALKADGRKVLMVGDGFNDAPALAAGHASISPANAADISQTAADAVLQGELLGSLATALEVARAARRRALENFAIAIGYNALFVPMAMAGLVTPLVAAIAMSASSIAVTANALRLAAQQIGGCAMTALAWLVPVALLLGGLGLAAFLWSLRSGQYDDLEGAGWRALDDEQVRAPRAAADRCRSVASGHVAARGGVS